MLAIMSVGISWYAQFFDVEHCLNIVVWLHRMLASNLLFHVMNENSQDIFHHYPGSSFLHKVKLWIADCDTCKFCQLVCQIETEVNIQSITRLQWQCLLLNSSLLRKIRWKLRSNLFLQENNTIKLFNYTFKKRWMVERLWIVWA